MYNVIYPVTDEELKIINYMIEVLQNKSSNISLKTLEDIGKLRIDYIMQVITVIWEGIVIKDILKIALNPKEKEGTK